MSRRTAKRCTHGDLSPLQLLVLESLRQGVISWSKTSLEEVAKSAANAAWTQCAWEFVSTCSNKTCRMTVVMALSWSCICHDDNRPGGLGLCSLNRDVVEPLPLR